MKRLRVLIVDDEPLAREGIAVLLRDEPDVEIIGTCADGKSALLQIGQQRPDLVFLDVQMPQLNGLDLCRTLPAGAHPAIVFITAYGHHAVSAFEMNAVDYLVKPFRDERFKAALLRAREQILRGDVEEMHRRAVLLLENLRHLDRGVMGGPAQGARLAFRSAGDHVFLNTVDIVWLEAGGDLVKVKAAGEIHLVREPLSALEKRLDPDVFVRLHRSFIVNARRIRKITPTLYGDHDVLTDDGTRIRMSRTYRDRLPRLIAVSTA